MVVTFTDCVLVEIVLVGTVLVGDTISWKPKFRSFKTNSDFFYLIERVISKSRGQILYRRSWSRGESPCRTSTWSSTAGRKSTWGTTVGRKLLGHWLAWILWSWRRPENKDCFRIFGASKGQLISKCLLEKIVWTKIATKKFDNFCPGGQIKKIKALYNTIIRGYLT